MAEKIQDDITGYVEFGDVARDRCGMQCQYAARNLAGEHGSGDVGSDLRWHGDTADYHNLLIHPDDADEFVRRLRKYRTEGRMGWQGEPE